MRQAEEDSELVLNTAHRAAVWQVEGCSELVPNKAHKDFDHSHYRVIQQLQSRAGSE